MNILTNASRLRGSSPAKVVLILAARVTLLSSFSVYCANAGAENRVTGLSGYWRLIDKGDAEPALTEWAKTEARKPDRRGDVDIASEQWCVFQGIPYVMDSAGNLEIRQSPAETVILAERLAIPRHVYFKIAERPSPEIFDFTPVGFSIGHVAGDELIVETDMFTDGIGLDGSPRTEKASLNERFKVSSDGTELVIVSTWTDPDVYTQPYVYTWTYERIPDDYTVTSYYCDPRANGVGNYPPGEEPRSDQSGE